MLVCLESTLQQSLVLQDFVSAHAISVIEALPSELAEHKYLLSLHEGAMALEPIDAKLGGPLLVDFSDASTSYRRQTSGIKQEVAKAVACKSDFKPSVLDVTAGLGGDAFVLASLGCQMQLLEKNPLVYLLLEDGLRRGSQVEDETLAAIVANNMQLKPCQDALLYMQSCPSTSIDVVYLDPMFPERKKSAKVKKAMQYFHDVVGLDEAQEQALLHEALRLAKKRVVVKRPKLAPVLEGIAPSFQMKAKSIRYDIYLQH